MSQTTDNNKENSEEYYASLLSNVFCYDSVKY